MVHLLLGSIGVLAETSELQRQAYNTAFLSEGLDWNWSRQEYSALLARSGGKKRLAAEAARRGEAIDVEAVHARKSRLFRAALRNGVPLRPGVGRAIDEARAAGGNLGLVTTTSPENVDLVLKATGLTHETFDCMIDLSQVQQAKPDPEAYQLALQRLGLRAEDAIAVEDNPDGFLAARDAGLQTLALPGVMHQGGQFPGALAVQSLLDLGVRRAA